VEGVDLSIQPVVNNDAHEVCNSRPAVTRAATAKFKLNILYNLNILLKCVFGFLIAKTYRVIDI
jgi:hypothetical protein